jgi:hypothetical protein
VGLFGWARGVVADRGEQEPLPIHLERSRDGRGYAFRLGIGAGFGGQETARVPVHRRANPSPHPILKEVHYCEIAGTTLEAANVYALKEKAAALLETVAPGRTLPICWFRAPAMDYELPVYERGGELTSPVVGGPRLRARDLAGIRARVSRYLVSAGYVSDADELDVGVLRPSDLSRVAPACIFRSQADPELWLPSVEGTSPDGPVVGLLGPSPRIATPRRRPLAGPPTREPSPAAPDVVALLRSVRAELARSRRPLTARGAEAVYAAQVRPEMWATLERRSEDARLRLVAYLTDSEATALELEVRRSGAGDVFVALEDRGINVLLAPSPDVLAARVGEFLAASGFLRFATEVEIHHPRPERPEWLEADSIRTFGDEGLGYGPAAAGNGAADGGRRINAVAAAGGRMDGDTVGAAGPTKEVDDA